MYITITPQKLGGTYSQSSADFIGYLEKENLGLEQDDQLAAAVETEYFFNQYGDKFLDEAVLNIKKRKREEVTRK